MKTLAASAAEENFGGLLDMAQSEPVRLQRQGRDVAVVLSPQEFHRLSEAAERRFNLASPRFQIGQGDRANLIKQAQEASRALKDDPRDRALLNDLEDLQAENADALRP